MEVINLIYKGPQIDDWETFEKLPENYQNLLREINGYIQFGGGFHVRGACLAPDWHSIRVVWTGKYSLSTLFSSIEPTDIPFGQDCLGDQYILRNNLVYRLQGEDGIIETIGCELIQFIENIKDDPINKLNLQPLLLYLRQGGILKPGELINAYPPFCTMEAGAGVSVNAVPTFEQINYLSMLSKFLKDVPDGKPFRIVVK